MASLLIQSARTVSGNQPAIRAINEAAGNTYKLGVPVMVDGAGNIIEWDGATVAQGIAGISKDIGNNLAVAGTAKTLTFGEVQNQALAVNIPLGAPLNDGKAYFEVANDDTVFFGEVGPLQTTAVADIGKQYGMSKDVDGHWYVDKLKVGADAVVVVVELDTQWDTTRGVWFKFLQSAQQLSA